ncbi:MAG: guanylate kinase [Gemmatimonadetes bacterium]|nr:guanylate kinase [Gemmatimonadota bacterium]
MSTPPRPVVLVGPSGAGKTTLAGRLVREYPGHFAFSVSATTRGPRPGERSGTDYHFVSRRDFEEMIDAGELAEWAEVHGEYYGTPLKNLRVGSGDEAAPVLDIDVQGARQIIKHGIGALVIFILPPGSAEWIGRLVGRGTESRGEIARRLRTALEELQAASSFEQFVVNAVLDQAVRQVHALASGDTVTRIGFSEVRALSRALDAGARLEIGRLTGAPAASAAHKEET